MKDKIIESFVDLGSTGAGYDTAMQISNKIQSLYFDNQFDVCVLIFNKFKSAIVQEVTQQQLIPLDIENKKQKMIKMTKKRKKIIQFTPMSQTKHLYYRICYQRIFLFKFLRYY
jgi:F-type H+-transporting ATPase subunit gamma